VSSAAVAEQLVERLAKAIERSQPERADGEMENLADMIVDALVFENRAVTAALYPAVDKLYTQHEIGNEGSDWGRIVSGQLRALTTVLSIAVRRRRAADGTELARDPKYQPLLETLLEANAPRTNQDIAHRLGVAEETVARNIPTLRAAGLVTATKAWKRKLNVLSPSGKEAIQKVRAENSREKYYEMEGGVQDHLQSIGRKLVALATTPTGEKVATETVSIEGGMKHYKEIDLKIRKEQENNDKLSIELKTA